MSIDEAEIALGAKRRRKFGLLWKNSINYFIEQNLYHLPQHNHQLKATKNGSYHNHLAQINIRSEDKKSQDQDHRVSVTQSS